MASSEQFGCGLFALRCRYLSKSCDGQHVQHVAVEAQAGRWVGGRASAHVARANAAQSYTRYVHYCLIRRYDSYVWVFRHSVVYH